MVQGRRESRGAELECQDSGPDLHIFLDLWIFGFWIWKDLSITWDVLMTCLIRHEPLHFSSGDSQWAILFRGVETTQADLGLSEKFGDPTVIINSWGT